MQSKLWNKKKWNKKMKEIRKLLSKVSEMVTLIIFLSILLQDSS